MNFEINDHINWINEKFIRHFAYRIPKLAGVYAIADVNRVLGLPTEIDLLYIGKAKNLRRRFLDHIDPRREHNKGLLLKKATHDIEFWFSEQSVNKIENLEKHLIQESNPSENIIRYGGRKNEHQ